VNLHWQISAGQFFELLRPAALVASALISTWLFAAARGRGVPLLVALLLAIVTLFLPLVILPLYLAAGLLWGWRSSSGNATDQNIPSPPRYRFLLPTVYLVLVLSLIAIYLYRDSRSVDAHLARAMQARVVEQKSRAIGEYRAALAREDSAHTHKLLAMELQDAGRHEEALSEFITAEKGGEADDSLPFRIAELLDESGRHDEATAAYRRFLQTGACRQSLPDPRCDTAQQAMSSQAAPRP